MASISCNRNHPILEGRGETDNSDKEVEFRRSIRHPHVSCIRLFAKFLRATPAKGGGGTVVSKVDTCGLLSPLVVRVGAKAVLLSLGQYSNR